MDSFCITQTGCDWGSCQDVILKMGETRTRVETKFLLLGYRGLSMQLPVWDIL